MTNLAKALLEFSQLPIARRAAGVGVEFGKAEHQAAKLEAGRFLNELLKNTNMPQQTSGARFLAEVPGSAHNRLGVLQPVAEGRGPWRRSIPGTGAMVSPSDAVNYFHDPVPVIPQYRRPLVVGEYQPLLPEHIESIRASMPYVSAEVPRFMDLARDVERGSSRNTVSLYDILKDEMYPEDLLDEIGKAGYDSLMFKKGIAGSGLPSDVTFLASPRQAKKVPMIMRDPAMTYDMIQELYPRTLYDPLRDAMR